MILPIFIVTSDPQMLAGVQRGQRGSLPLDAVLVVRIVNDDFLVVVGNHILAVIVVLLVVDVDPLIATGRGHPGDRVVGGGRACPG